MHITLSSHFAQISFCDKQNGTRTNILYVSEKPRANLWRSITHIVVNTLREGGAHLNIAFMPTVDTVTTKFGTQIKILKKRLVDLEDLYKKLLFNSFYQIVQSTEDYQESACIQTSLVAALYTTIHFLALSSFYSVGNMWIGTCKMSRSNVASAISASWSRTHPSGQGWADKNNCHIFTGDPGRDLTHF